MLLGFEVLAIPFSLLPLEVGALAVVIVTLIRLGVVSLLISALRAARPGFDSSIRILAWGGLRGGLSLALALSVPHNQHRTWTLVATYCVVLFSTTVQGGSMDLFLRRLLKKPAAAAHTADLHP